MENPSGEQQFLFGSGVDAETIAEFAQILPAVYYGINRVLDVCAPTVPRKVLVVLFTLASSTSQDEVGTFITTGDINRTFRDWLVVTESNVSSEVSKVKDALFELNFIKIEGGKDHIHLTDKGGKALRGALGRATAILGETLAVLKPEEQRLMKGFAARMLETIRKPPAKEGLGDTKDEADTA
jgi:DNA-binding MarR family transcriptional regulator